jgi:hypothetical protein
MNMYYDSLTCCGSRYATFHLPFVFLSSNACIMQNNLLRMVTKNTYTNLIKFVCGTEMLTYMHQTVTRLTSRRSWRYIMCKLLKSITSFCGRVVLNTHVGIVAVIVWMPCFMVCMIHVAYSIPTALRSVATNNRMVCHAHTCRAPHPTQRNLVAPPFAFKKRRELPFFQRMTKLVPSWVLEHLMIVYRMPELV